MAQRAHSSLRLSIPRLVLLFITLCCVCSLGVLLRYSQLNVGDKSLGRFYPKSTLFKAREVFVLTPRRHRGQAEWIREDQTARPACERKGCKESCVDDSDEATHMKLKWECFSVQTYSDLEAKAEPSTCAKGTHLEYKSDRLANLPELPSKLSLLLVGDSTARQLYESIKAFRGCTARFSQVHLRTFQEETDRFADVNLGGKAGNEDHLRLSHDLDDAFRNRISLAWTNRLMDGEARVDVAYREPQNWITRRYWKEVIDIARGSDLNRLVLVFSFGPHFNGLSSSVKREKARKLLNHTSSLLRFGELLQEHDSLVFLTVNAGIVVNDTDSQASKYYHHWKAQEKFFNREFPRLVLRRSGLKSFIFNSTFMQRIKVGRDTDKNDMMHFQHPGRAPLDELVYSLLYATRLL